MRSSNLLHGAILLVNLFDPTSFDKYVGNSNLASIVYAVSSVKLIASLGALFNFITVQLWLNQGIGFETSNLMRYSFANILNGWLPSFIKDVVPILGTSAYFVNL